MTAGPEASSAAPPTGRPTGWRCAVCGAERDIAESMPWRCPDATSTDRHHVMHIVSPGAPLSPQRGGTARSTAERPVESGFSAHRDELAWAAYASANGVAPAEQRAMLAAVDRAVGDLTGVRFVATPCARSDELSDAMNNAAVDEGEDFQRHAATPRRTN